MNKILVSAVVFATFLSISCKKKSEEKPVETTITPSAPVSSAESKNIMSGSKDAMKNDVVSLTKGQGVTELTNMADVIVALDPTEPISLSRIASGEGIEPNEMAGLLSKQAKVFKKLFFPTSVIKSLNRTESLGSSFTENIGNYTWKESSKTWTKTENKDNYIVISFPSDSTKRNENDAVFTLINYADIVTDEDTLPTSIIADLKVKGKKVASINYTGAYAKDGMPTAMNGSVFLDPFTYTVSFTDNASSVSGSTTLLKNTDVIAGISSTINLTGTGSNRTATSLSGSVSYRNIKMAGSVNNLNKTEDDSTTAQINSHFDMDILRTSDNAKIADLNLAERKDTKGETETYIRMTYTDGTTEDIVNYLKPASDELEKFLEDQSN
jgi:hypothetical protein